MSTPGRKPLYRHTGTALLRAAAAPLNAVTDWWPDPADPEACRVWLEQTWSRSDFADAIRQAGPTLTRRVDAIRDGHVTQDKRIRRATVSTARYLLRATGRPTPFGLFAGVAPVGLGPTARVRWGKGHRPVARVDTAWLAGVIESLEERPELLERLDVAFNNLAVRCGGRLQVPYGGPRRATIRYTSAVRAVQKAAAAPVRFGALVDEVTEALPGADRSKVCGMLTELVRRGFLITCLRAPLTVTDPLAHLLDRLREAGADTLPSAVPLVRDLEAVRADVHHHNHEAPGAEQSRTRDAVTHRMRHLSSAGRTPLAVDLLLDGDIRLPRRVAHEMERAAGALLRLTRRPTGHAVWRDFHAAFWERYGTGTLVPLTEVLDPAAGLGYPAEYPGSTMTPPVPESSERDERLLALAWEAAADGSGEIVLTDETVDALAGGERFDERYIPPHVELSARVNAAGTAALDRGEFTLTVAPARSAGTLTSRFTPAAGGSGLADVYRSLPAGIEGALPAQLSFPPLYPHTENVCRIPAYLPHVIVLGEHRGPAEAETVIPVEDLAVTATHDRLHLVSISRQQVVEPQVFHAMALEKQPPPLARFLAHLPRAFTAAWTGFDWGPHAARLPYLPRVCYRRTVLAPARWHLAAADLPGGDTDPEGWRKALLRWRDRRHCPGTVELRDDDRTLRLTLDEPVHAAILHAHLKRHGHAVLTETPAGADAFGWIDGHVHEIALPLVTTRPAAPSPLNGPLPRLVNSALGPLPGSAGARWLNAKIFTHPERYDELITAYLPQLLAALGEDVPYWFVRYRSPHETHHLRLRLRTTDGCRYAAYAAVVGEWAERLRRDAMAGRLVLDAYDPEIGRYGQGAAMDAAEAVFAADSRVAAVFLRHLPVTAVHPTALTTVNMVNIARGFLGPDEAMEWLATRPATPAAPVDRTVADQAVRLAQRRTLRDLPGWPGQAAAAWQARAAALAAYRAQLPGDHDTDAVLESLLHMHHNRAVGIDQGGERTCRRLARQAALTWRAQQGGDNR